MNTVFVINKSSHDYSLAEKFGKIEFLTKGRLNRFNVSNIYRTVEDTIKNSSADDYLLIGGPSIIVAVVCAMFVKKHGRLNFLIFKSKINSQGKYVKKTVIF